MKKEPIRSSFKTQSGFDRALKKWNDSNTTKKPVKKKTITKTKPSSKLTIRDALEAKAKEKAKKPVAKKPVAKKPVAKKPVAKKPVAKKPVAKKPAGKVPAKKPLLSNKQKLQIKKAATRANKAVKTVVKKTGNLKKTVGKKVTAAKKVLTKKASTPRPKTGLQKLASKGNKALKSTGKYIKGDLRKNVSKKSGDILKGIAKKGGLVRGIKNAGLAIAAERVTDAVQKRIAKGTTKRGRNQTFKEFNADFTKMRKEREVLPTAKRTLKGIGNVLTGRKFTKNNKTLSQKLNEERVKRQKDKPTTDEKVTNKKLKVNKTPNKTKSTNKGPTVKSINRTDYNVDTKSGLAAYNKAKNNLTNKSSSSSKPKKMHAIEKRNRKIFGDAHVDKLKAKHAAFKERRKKKKTLF